MGRLHSAVTRAFELDSAYSKALYYVGDAQFKLGRTGQARGELEKYLYIEPTDTDALLNMAAVELKDNRKAEAEKLFDKALEADENLHAAWFNKAAFLSGEGRYGEALPCFSRAIDLMPS